MKSEHHISKRFGLARVISKMGLASRTQASKWIHEGLVQVNGKTITNDEYPVRIHIDKVSISQQQAVAQQRIVLMLNKPRGLVTTRSDEQQRATVYDCLSSDLPWLAPVGRLDKASEGMLLMTNDPVWAASITSPETGPDKTYHVQVNAIPCLSQLSAMLEGVNTELGQLRVKHVSLLRRGEKNAWLEITLDEGQNRQIRRVLQAFDIEVLRLIRVAIGRLQLGDLPKGQWRILQDDELPLLNNP
ncbi:MAG: rRNA pseudouridine synthase [Arenimonas sp.]|nr:rRNA pseudouridine synthase [Arenimonas sp.]